MKKILFALILSGSTFAMAESEDYFCTMSAGEETVEQAILIGEVSPMYGSKLSGKIVINDIEKKVTGRIAEAKIFLDDEQEVILSVNNIDKEAQYFSTQAILNKVVYSLHCGKLK